MPNFELLANQEEICLKISNVDFRLLMAKRKKLGVPSTIARTTMHTHISTELFACEEGKLTLEMQNGTVTIEGGDAIIVPPGIPHYPSNISEGTIFYTVSFVGHKTKDPSALDLYHVLQSFFAGDEVLLFKNHPGICSKLKEIIRDAQKNKLLTVMHMVELLVKASEMEHSKLSQSDNFVSNRDSRSDIQRMMKLDQFINAYFYYDLSCEDIAKYLYISSRQLDRIVKKRYGKSLHRLITDKRIECAERMLRTTDVTIEKIGVEVGFGSRAGFYREFTKAYGLSPSDYRKSKKT